MDHHQRIGALVLDTNFLISHLDIVEDLGALGPQFGHVLIIPYKAIEELDGLKQRPDVGPQARAASNWIVKRLGEQDPHVTGQRMTQITRSGLQADDAILDCCRYFFLKHEAFTVILSNDRLLCTKALIHGIRTVSYVKALTALQIAQKVREHLNDPSAIVDQNDSFEAEPTSTAGDSMEVDDDRSHVPVVDPEPPQTKPEATKEYELRPAPLLPFAFSDTESLADAVREVDAYLARHVANCIDSALLRAYDNDIEELRYLGYEPSTLQGRGLDSARKVIDRFGVSVFSEFLPARLRKKLKDTPRFTAASYSELKEHVELWTSVWMHLSSGVYSPDEVRETSEEIEMAIAARERL